MPERRSVGPSHLCPANRLFPTFLQHAKLVSGPIYPRPVSAIHTKHEKLTTKAIRYNCIVHSSVKRVIVAVVCLKVGDSGRRGEGIVSGTSAISNHIVRGSIGAPSSISIILSWRCNERKQISLQRTRVKSIEVTYFNQLDRVLYDFWAINRK